VRGERTSILVVDDDDDVRESIRCVLAEEGYNVACASDGAEALDHLRTGSRPDLILLDMMMPRMDGSQFRAAQLEDPALATIPVVLVTADAHGQERIKTMGAFAYLKKPVRLEQLLEIVERFCPKH
jgi:CheY-like chemotaxis protein